MPAWQDFGGWNGGVAARRADLTEQERLWATVTRAEADRETQARWPGDCLLGAMAGKPTGRAGMFRRGPENRAGTFVRRSCRASGSAVGSSGGSGQAARARGAKRCGIWPVAHRTRSRQMQCRSVRGECPIRIGFALYYECPACAKKSHKPAVDFAMPVTRSDEGSDEAAG